MQTYNYKGFSLIEWLLSFVACQRKKISLTKTLSVIVEYLCLDAGVLKLLHQRIANNLIFVLKLKPLGC